MDLQAEYDDFINSLGDHGAATFKFFELFRICLGDDPRPPKGESGQTRGLHYGKQASDASLSDEELKSLKTFLKTQRSWLRKEQKNADKGECRRRMWFWVQKLIEFGAFDRPTRRDITYWMDVSIERTFEGCEMRILSVGGHPAFTRSSEKIEINAPPQ
jgi:hypothetical protein